MSFPINNNIFQKGNFDGFSVHGRCRVDKDFKHRLEPGNTIKTPGFGHSMAILDDPNLIDHTDGTRLSSAKLPANALTPPATAKSFDTSDYSFTDASQQITRGTDGACLEVTGVKIKAGHMIKLQWDFVRYEDRFDMNDFALVEILDEDTTGLINRDYLVQSSKMKRSDGMPRWSSGWMQYSWLAKNNSKITARIVVSNGYTYSGVIGPDPLQKVTSRAFPSGLLLDGIWLV